MQKRTLFEEEEEEEEEKKEEKAEVLAGQEVGDDCMEFKDRNEPPVGSLMQLLGGENGRLRLADATGDKEALEGEDNEVCLLFRRRDSAISSTQLRTIPKVEAEFEEAEEEDEKEDADRRLCFGCTL
eukprot:3939199-Rhodomonas_salina.4